jgi:cytochrome P450
MTAIGISDAPIMVGTRPPPKKAPPFPFQSGEENPIERVPRPAYELPIWRPRFGSSVFLNDPAGIKRVLIDNVANYPKMDMENRFFRALFGDGLLSREGEAWRTHRRIMAPSFDPRSVAGYAPAMAAASAEFADEWARLDNASEIDVSEEMTRLTLEIICRSIFSTDYQEMTAISGSALARSSDAFDFNLLDILPIIGEQRLKAREKKMAAIFASLDGAISRLIEARKADPSHRDLLGRLVAQMDEETGAKLTPQEVRDEVLTIFVAGHETTASAMTFTWYALAHQPEWEAKLHAELDAVLGGRTPTEADLAKLSVTRRIIEETMRLYPPAPGISTRIAKQADEISGMKIRKGAMIQVSSWILHRHAELWDNPFAFDPDRFLPERSVGRPRFAYLPFGGGPRVCIGQAMAMQEATLILATLAQRFRLRMRPGHHVQIQQRVTIRPRGGLPMRIERR